MRESFGGTMIFWIVLFLFSIFITFTAIIIKYARVYKIKNSVVNYVIKKQGNVTHLEIDKKLRSMSYQEDGTYKICRYFPTEMGEFYYIELYSVTELPIIGSWVYFSTKVKGETRTINVNDDNININRVDSNGQWFSGTVDQCLECVFQKGTGTSKCDLVEVK